MNNKSRTKLPLFAFEGSSYKCGIEYTKKVLQEFPHFSEYLTNAQAWQNIQPEIKKTFSTHAPFIIDFYRGVNSQLNKSGFKSSKNLHQSNNECTSFSLSPNATINKLPISGQNKDTSRKRAKNYIVLHLKFSDGPSILVLAYPGELLGYGMWSTRMTIFRNSLHSTGGGITGLTMEQWGLLSLASESLGDSLGFIERFGLKGMGNCIISDPKGHSASIEFNCGGIDIIYPTNGVLVHANHPVGKNTSQFENYQDSTEKENSRYRMEHLFKILESNHSKLSVPKAHEALSDHSRYPRGICRHKICESWKHGTTACIIANPNQGELWISNGNPCCNDPVLYSI